MRPVLALVAAAVTMAGLAGCTSGSPAGTPSPSPSTTIAPANPTILPTATIASGIAMRVGEGVAPPTNRWYSSLAFGDGGLPVFPKPLSVTPTDGGFSFGLTTPVAGEAVIAAGAVADVAVAVDGASGLGTVTAADPDAVTLSWGDASLSLAQGWPVVALSAAAAVTAELSVPFEDGEATVNGRLYGVKVTDGSLDGTTLKLEEGGSAQFFAVPAGGSAGAFASALGAVVTGVTWSGKVAGSQATTTLDYGTQTVVTLPAERAAGLECALGSYETIDGSFAVCAASSVTWSAPAVTATDTLSLAGITAEQRTAIADAVKADLAATGALPSDTYFGGKALYRLANLMLLGEQLGDTASAKTALTLVAQQLTDWGDPTRCATADARCFVYDPAFDGIVGQAVSFGSEQFNDHHFHYGYLLYAAAVAGARDPALLASIAPVMDLVAADIAGGAGGPFTPIRVFDPVAGHSWASGTSPFADGNNQESSSEAVAAWNGVALWAKVRGDAPLEQRATWMLSMEADAAVRLWLDPDLGDFPAYSHRIVAIEWGAKRDYATWFSPEPSAMLGIQLIPMAPASAQYLARVPADQAAASVSEATAGGVAQFADYLLMYRALGGDGATWDQALALEDGAIDDGDSRAYLLAYIAAALSR